MPVDSSLTELLKIIYTQTGSEHAVEHSGVLPLIQINRRDRDHRRPTGLVLKHADVVKPLREARTIVVDVQNGHQDLKGKEGFSVGPGVKLQLNVSSDPLFSSFSLKGLG